MALTLRSEGTGPGETNRARMRKTLLCMTFLATLGLPAMAEIPVASGTQDALVESQQDRLQRYGARLSQLDQKFRVVQRLRDLTTSDQMDALHRLRISPSQAISLLKLFQENAPTGEVDDEAWKAFRRKITPKAEDILGSQMFDTLLELTPSPAQREQAQAILKEVGATPDGIQAYRLAQELKATLNPDQQRSLGPLLDLLKPNGARPAPEPKSKPAPKGKPLPGAEPQRRLVLLKKNSLGDTYAEIPPHTDYGLFLPQVYRLDGVDPDIVSAMSNREGLPVRLLGEYGGDVIKVARSSLMGPPSLLAVPDVEQIWRGRLPARVVSTAPPVVQVDLGRGQTLNAEPEFSSDRERKGFDAVARAGRDFLVQATGYRHDQKWTLVDMEFSEWQPVNAAFSSSCVMQLSEELLQHAAVEYLAGHRDQLSGGDVQQLHFQVRDLGLTLQGCQPGQVRVFGRVSAAHGPLRFLEGEVEVLTRPSFQQGKVQFAPVPRTLQLRLSYPCLANAPKEWIDNLEAILGSEYLQGVSVALTDQYRDSIVKSGALQAEQIDRLQFFTFPSGDRRTSLVALAAPAVTPGTTNDALRNRIQAPGEYTLALGDEVINGAIQKNVPPMLPIRRPVPEHLRMQDGVSLNEVEIPELDLSFSQGQFVIKNCVVNVNWSWGMFSGTEPGCRFQGTANLVASGTPPRLMAQIKVSSMEFLSSRILSGTPEEQKSQKDRLIRTFEDNLVELPTFQDPVLSALSSRATLSLTGAGFTASPSELLLHGCLKP